jgi:hypothetical protein
MPGLGGYGQQKGAIQDAGGSFFVVAIKKAHLLTTQDSGSVVLQASTVVGREAITPCNALRFCPLTGYIIDVFAHLQPENPRPWIFTAPGSAREKVSDMLRAE